MNKEMLAYTAGIIDGEGCIGITKSKIIKEMKNPFYRFFVEVKNTDSRLIDFLYNNFGGHKRIENRKTVNNHIVYTWYIDGDRGVKFLQGVYKFIVCKKEQCETVFRFRQTFINHYTHGIPQDILNIRENSFQYLKLLHGRYTDKGLWAKDKNPPYIGELWEINR